MIPMVLPPPPLHSLSSWQFLLTLVSSFGSWRGIESSDDEYFQRSHKLTKRRSNSEIAKLTKAMRYYRLRSQLPTSVRRARSCFDEDRITEANTSIGTPLHVISIGSYSFFSLLVG